jgi:hypothetical protein
LQTDAQDELDQIYVFYLMMAVAGVTQVVGVI